MTRPVLMIVLLSIPLAAAPADRTISFTKLWTHSHATAGQLSEIPAFDHRTNTVWVAGVVGVDVLNGDTPGALVEHIDVTPYGLVNSVSIHNGLAAFAIEAGPPDRRRPGVVVFYDTRTRERVGEPITVGALPDMLTFTHDGSKLLVANEGTPNAVADTAYAAPDPAGSVSIIDVETRTVIATAGLNGVPQFGDNLRTDTGMDFEPEYISVEHDGSRAFVTLQEANAIAMLDLSLNAFTEIIGLGVKDFRLEGNEFDPKDNDGSVSFINADARALYMPDGVASYQSRPHVSRAGQRGRLREDNADRSAAGSAPYPHPRRSIGCASRMSTRPRAISTPTVRVRCRFARQTGPSSTTAAAFSIRRHTSAAFTTTAEAATRVLNRKAWRCWTFVDAHMRLSVWNGPRPPQLRCSISAIRTT